MRRDNITQFLVLYSELVVKSKWTLIEEWIREETLRQYYYLYTIKQFVEPIYVTGYQVSELKNHDSNTNEQNFKYLQLNVHH